MVEAGELKKDKPIVISVSKELVDILDEVKKYIIDYSYGSLNPSYYEASKLLAYKLKKKGKIL